MESTHFFSEVSCDPSRVETHLAARNGLLHFAIRRYVRARPDLAVDLVAVARVALAEALETYTADIVLSFGTYATNRMKWQCSQFLRQFTRKDRQTDSLDAVMTSDDGQAVTRADVFDREASQRARSEGITEEYLFWRLYDLRAAVAT